MDFSHDVFLSHSSKDIKTVRELAFRLKSNGLRVWFSEWEIMPGDLIPLKIEQGLERSRTLILCMSASAFSSDWVTLERHTLLFRDPTNSQRRFIPLRLDNSKIQDVLQQFSYIDWRKRETSEYHKLLKICSRPQDLPASTIPKGRKHKTPDIVTVHFNRVMGGHDGRVNDLALVPHEDALLVITASEDYSLKLWNYETGEILRTFVGHRGEVNSVAVKPDGSQAVSGSSDGTIRIWDLRNDTEHKVLDNYRGRVNRVILLPDGEHLICGSSDKTITVWDLTTGQIESTLSGHTDRVENLSLSSDGKILVSASADNTIKIWNLETQDLYSTLVGHSELITSVAVTPKSDKVVSGSRDKTIKVWDMQQGTLLMTLEGHTDVVTNIELTRDGKYIISSSADKTLKMWDMKNGACVANFVGHTGTVFRARVTYDRGQIISCSDDMTLRVWNIPVLSAVATYSELSRYANAKVVVIGESGVGKTGLAIRLAENRWEVTESTHGMKVYKLAITHVPDIKGVEREIWLWDFAGQQDYRLIHQLSIDEAALALVVFNPQDDNPFEDLTQWTKILETKSAFKFRPAKILVAARSDRGKITVGRAKYKEYCDFHSYSEFIETSAKSGDGCEELRRLIAKGIPWEKLPWTATTRLFKMLKDAIVAIKSGSAGQVHVTPLIRFAELRQLLHILLPDDEFTEQELRVVVGLLASQGLIQPLSFGDFILMQPEVLNSYATAVVRAVNDHPDEIGCIKERDVLEANIDFKDMQRLRAVDEKILLRSIVQTLLDRSLCLRQETEQGDQLVFPSYYKLDKPDNNNKPAILITYGFEGPLADIYSTLVVRLNYSKLFDKKELWKNSANFQTAEGKQVGLSMIKKKEGSAEIVIYFDHVVGVDIKVMFIKYVHEHLLKHGTNVSRIRHYVCPHCHEPVEGHKAVRKRMERGERHITCSFCDKDIQLIDMIEEKFMSALFSRQVQELDEKAGINIDNESKELILIGHAFAISGEAGQIFRPVPNSDWGIDGEIEFKNNKGQASGKRVYLQLKSGDSYLYKRERDGKEIFQIKNPRHAEYWQSHAYPVMLVIRTADGAIRWMNVTEYLKTKGGDSPSHIVFEGEQFTALNVSKLRDKLVLN